MKLPEPTWYERKGLVYDEFEDITRSGYAKLYTEAQLKQALKDVLEQAAQAAVDAVAFTGGTVETEAHVRWVFRKMIGEIK